MMNFRIAILAFFAALTCAVANPIKSFVVKGVVYTNKAEVLKTIGLKKGDELSNDDFPAIIKKLHDAHHFDRVDLDFSQGRLTITVVAPKKIASVKMNLVDGVTKEWAKQYLKTIDFEVGDIYSDDKLAAVVRGFEMSAMHAGYNDVDVNVDLKPYKAHSVAVSIEVLTGEGYTLDDLVFEGSTVFTTKQLQQFSGLNPTTLLSIFTNDDRVSEIKLISAQAALQNAYASEGYFDVAINKQTSRDDANKKLRITYQITEGAPTRIKEVKLDGFSKNAREKLEKIGLKKGNILKRPLIQLGERVLERDIKDEGRPFSRISLSFEKAGENMVNIIVKQERGAVQKVRFIQFSGNTKTTDGTLRRQFDLVEGELFSQSKLDAAIQAINDLEYIESAKATVYKKSKGQVDIQVTIKERSTATISLQGAFDKQSGLVFSSSYNDKNFLGYGNMVSIDLERAMKGNQNYSISWHSPVSILNPNWSESISLGYNRSYSTIRDGSNESSPNSNYYDSSLFLNIKEGIPLSENFRYFPGLGVEFRATNSAEPGTIAASFVNKFGHNFTLISILNDLRFGAGTLSGDYGSIKGEFNSVFVPNIESKGISYFKIQARIEQNMKVGELYEQPFVFNPILRAGYGRGLSDQLKTLPYYAKFNLGGSDMLVRGLDPSAAGPYYIYKKPVGIFAGQVLTVDRTDFAGADQYMGLNLSLWVPSPMPDFVIPGIYFDIANFSTDEFKGSGIRYSMGLAARLNTPMGIINLAYGIKTEAIGKDEPQKLWFSMSQRL